MLLDGRFGNGASSAGSDVLPDILSKVRPIEILLQYCHYFLDPKIPTLLHLAEILTLASDAFDQMSEISPNFFNPTRNRRYTDI